MKLILVLVVRDEADILDTHIAYHLHQGVDYVLAIDNGSIDASTEILEKYQRAGRLQYWSEPAHTLMLREWHNKLTSLAQKEFGADIVINSDVDEFWWPKKGTLHSTLSSLSRFKKAVVVERTNYLPIDSSKLHSPGDCILRAVERINLLGDPLPPKVLHRPCAHTYVSLGNHELKIRDSMPLWQKMLFPYRVSASDELEIFHFPIRSYQQFEDKVRRFGVALETHHKGKIAPSRVVKKIYDAFLEGSLPDIYREYCAQSSTPDTRLREYLSSMRSLDAV